MSQFINSSPQLMLDYWAAFKPLTFFLTYNYERIGAWEGSPSNRAEKTECLIQRKTKWAMIEKAAKEI